MRRIGMAARKSRPREVHSKKNGKRLPVHCCDENELAHFLGTAAPPASVPACYSGAHGFNRSHSAQRKRPERNHPGWLIAVLLEAENGVEL